MNNAAEKSIAGPLLVTGGIVIFGDFAQDIAAWIVCRESDFDGNKCKDGSRATAIMIATGVSTMVAIISASFVSSQGPKDHRNFVLTVVGALIGAYFTVLKAAAIGAPYPLWERLDVATYIYLVIAFTFSGPAILSGFGFNHSAVISSFRRIATVLLVGGILGFIAQTLGEILWPLLYDVATVGGSTKYDWGGDKFVIAPSGVVALGAAWGAMMLDPWLRPEIWITVGEKLRRNWLVGYFLGAILLTGTYGWLIYFARHSDDYGWLRNADINRFETGLVDMVLVLPGLMAFSASVLAIGGILRTRQLLPTMFLAAGAAMLCSARVGYLRADAGLVHRSNFQYGDIPGFVASHALAAAAIGLTIVVANHLSDRLERQYQRT